MHVKRINRSLKMQLDVDVNPPAFSDTIESLTGVYPQCNYSAGLKEYVSVKYLTRYEFFSSNFFLVLLV